MCGIAGKLQFTEGEKVEEKHITAMMDAIRHRGPDDAGTYCHGPVGLGFRRLSIIDLSPAGHQPMSNEDGSVWIIFNGEIYNYQDIRKELETRGHTFRSHTDTETILHLYEDEGVQCLQRLRGMFALAIWDERKQQLFLARDRIGKKPLKYYIGKDYIAFASELKALLQLPDVPRILDADALHHYLTFQYVPHPQTGFQGIQKLPPAHYLTVQLTRDGPKISGPHRYWQIQYGTKREMSRGEVEEEILRQLEESVRIRMIADVPLGAFLSGGVDSSAVVAMMARNSTQPVKTFSIGFPEASHNELPRARIVAQAFGTDHTEFVVEPKALDIFDALVQQYEEPYADSSALPMWYLSQLTRQHVTVALNGDGGDEAFAGYPWYVFQKIASQLDALPGPLARLLLLPFAHMPGALQNTFLRRAKIFASTHHLDRRKRYLGYYTSSFFTEEEKRGMYTPAFSARVHGADTRALFQSILAENHGTDALDEAFAADITTYLPDALLVKVDIASMAHSLEVRCPFLDHQLLEFSASIPSAMKMQGYAKKVLLKEALRGTIPEEILTGKKMGFMVPLDAWFRGPLAGAVRERLLSPGARIHAIIQQGAIERLIEEHQQGRINHGSRLWSLMTLNQWLEQYKLSL